MPDRFYPPCISSLQSKVHSVRETTGRLLPSILNDSPDSKILLFTDTNFLSKTEMQALNAKELIGSKRTIDKRIEEHQEGTGNCRLLVLGPANMGTGLNLQATIHVAITYQIEYEDLYKQVIGRALRIDRNRDLKPLQIYQFITNC